MFYRYRGIFSHTTNIDTTVYHVQHAHASRITLTCCEKCVEPMKCSENKLYGILYQSMCFAFFALDTCYQLNTDTPRIIYNHPE